MACCIRIVEWRQNVTDEQSWFGIEKPEFGLYSATEIDRLNGWRR